MSCTTATAQGDEPLSCLGMAVSDSIQGPYTNKGLILKSGMGADLMDEDGNLYQATTDPNVVRSMCSMMKKEDSGCCMVLIPVGFLSKR